jgi:hypothetical protein
MKMPTPKHRAASTAEMVASTNLMLVRRLDLGRAHDGGEDPEHSAHVHEHDRPAEG